MCIRDSPSPHGGTVGLIGGGRRGLEAGPLRRRHRPFPVTQPQRGDGERPEVPPGGGFGDPRHDAQRGDGLRRRGRRGGALRLRPAGGFSKGPPRPCGKGGLFHRAGLRLHGWGGHGGAVGDHIPGGEEKARVGSLQFTTRELRFLF